MTRSLAYEAVNKPWRIPLVLRARRFGMLRQQRIEADTVAWFAAQAREVKRARLMRMYGGTLDPWQIDMLERALAHTNVAVTLHTSDPAKHPGKSLVAAAPYQHGRPVSFVAPADVVTHVGVWDSSGRYIESEAVGIADAPPWVRRAFGWDEDDQQVFDQRVCATNTHADCTADWCRCTCHGDAQ